MTSNSANSLLLFGDYGTEVIRLSQLYDPEKARYQRLPSGTKPTRIIDPNTGNTITRKVYYPEQRQRTLFFTEVTSPAIDPSGYYSEPYWIDTWDQLTDTQIREREANSQEGNYVPVPQTLVVVDTATQRWGQYTLLVVDRVETEGVNGEAPSYQSTLVPINFSGGIDDASRAIDYDNNTMMLYVEDITLGNGSKVQRLVPDRKLMMYGQKAMRYVIRKSIGGLNTVICTNSYISPHGDAMEYIDYVSAAGAINGSLIQITNVDTFKSLSGKRVIWFDEDGNRQDRTVELQLNLDGTIVENSPCDLLYKELLSVYDRGGNVVVVFDGGDSLNNVQIPGVSYLRKTLPPLVAGEIVEFMVYEMNTTDNGETYENRLVFASKLTVRDGSSLSVMDVTDAVITGFDVRLGSDETSDIWEIPQGTTFNEEDRLNLLAVDSVTKTAIHPYLSLDDGGEESIADIDADNKAFYMYGMEQLNGAAKGAEFDVIFKYFPPKKLGIKSNTTIDARYMVTNERQPSPLKRYFVKDVENNFTLAENDGHPHSFMEGETYYIACTKMMWDNVVSRPNKEMLVCRKRIRVIEGASNELRRISMIPVWDNATNTYSFNFLVYRKDMARPHLISTTPNDYGSVKMSGDLAKTFPKYRDGSRDDTIYNADLSYIPATGASGVTAANTEKVAFRLQHWTFESIGKTKWQISTGSHATFPVNDNGTIMAPYGTHNLDNNIRRPYLLCRMVTDQTTHKTQGVFRVPIDAEGFPNQALTSTDLKANHRFLREFYFRAIDGDDLWAEEGNHDESKYPTHFVVRSATDDGIETAPMPLKTEDTLSGNQAYGSEFSCEGLPVPGAECYAIVIVEFLYWNGSEYEHLLGVPVEVRLDTSN